MTFCTTEARVELVQAGREHRPVSQLLIVGTMELLDEVELETTSPTSDWAFKQDASDEPTMEASVD